MTYSFAMNLVGRRIGSLALRLLCFVAFLVAGTPGRSQSQTTDAQTALLDKMTGHWVLEGMIAGKQTVHDIDAAWVLNRGYVRLHEVSRKKNADGSPSYEAIIFINWDPKAQEYKCLFLDSTSNAGLNGDWIAHAKPSPDAIPLIFNISPTEKTFTTFTYQRSSDTWHWTIDDQTDSKTKRFADVTLSRAH